MSSFPTFHIRHRGYTKDNFRDDPGAFRRKILQTFPDQLRKLFIMYGINDLRNIDVFTMFSEKSVYKMASAFVLGEQILDKLRIPHSKLYGCHILGNIAVRFDSPRKDITFQVAVAICHNDGVNLHDFIGSDIDVYSSFIFEKRDFDDWKGIPEEYLEKAKTISNRILKGGYLLQPFTPRIFSVKDDKLSVSCFSAIKTLGKSI